MASPPLTGIVSVFILSNTSQSAFTSRGTTSQCQSRWICHRWRNGHGKPTTHRYSVYLAIHLSLHSPAEAPLVSASPGEFEEIDMASPPLTGIVSVFILSNTSQSAFTSRGITSQCQSRRLTATTTTHYNPSITGSVNTMYECIMLQNCLTHYRTSSWIMIKSLEIWISKKTGRHFVTRSMLLLHYHFNFLIHFVLEIYLAQCKMCSKYVIYWIGMHAFKKHTAAWVCMHRYCNG